jgi:dTDP-4-dehydrorhamnose 3,5-epimerase
MEVIKTRLEGVLLVKPPTIFEDFRGSYIEIYNEQLYHAAGINQEFIQDDISTSGRHVLRGLHGDGETWKLVSCLHGEFFLAVVNYIAGSPQYLQWDGFTLSDRNRLQVLIPPRFGNGHVVLSATAIFHYKQTSYYNRAGQFTLAWNDPRLGIRWPVAEPILSERDKTAEWLK